MDCLVHRVAKSRARLSDFHIFGRTGSLLLCVGFSPVVVCGLLIVLAGTGSRLCRLQYLWLSGSRAQTQ